MYVCMYVCVYVMMNETMYVCMYVNMALTSLEEALHQFVCLYHAVFAGLETELSSSSLNLLSCV